MVKKIMVTLLVAGLLTATAIMVAAGTGPENTLPVSEPAGNAPKSLAESSEWVGQAGDEVLIYQAETYAYD